MGKALKRKGDKNMKKMRKIFAVLLSLAMVLGMSITSFAIDIEQKQMIKLL